MWSGKDKDGNKIMATNLMLVERAVSAVKVFGKEPATSAEACEILGVSSPGTARENAAEGIAHHSAARVGGGVIGSSWAIQYAMRGLSVALRHQR